MDKWLNHEFHAKFVENAYLNKLLKLAPVFKGGSQKY